jgi:hypothetical protein
MSAEKVFLSRRNLLTLLSKLDRAKMGENTNRTLIKSDMDHPTMPQTSKVIFVVAVEDEDYYKDRPPGGIHPKDDPRLAKVLGLNMGRGDT